MMRIPVPVLLAFAILIVWPAAQIATLLLFRMRVQELAIRAANHLGTPQTLALHVPIWAKLVGGALLAFGFIVASQHQLRAILEKGLF